ncbi:MAG: NAD-dependent epimerase/dehydratase family protein [Deltaproteobacteria bacterium]|jgi:GDP-L-fucose synthase|nr:NAD-dependent epimerase/dehydratase family protein [Deltaproteobacteria bacterium]
MLKDSKIFIPNHHDMVGASILHQLRQDGYSNIITRDDNELDLTDEFATDIFFESAKPEFVFCFAGSHGGIIKNTSYPADIIYEVLKVQIAIIHAAYKHKVNKLLFLAGNCIYPKFSNQPIVEDFFMDGKMEPTSAAYSTARAAGVEMCWAYNRQYGTNFIPAILPNYYGPGDDYTEDGHVLASILNKIYNAKVTNLSKVVLWGTGTPKRQFMFSQDIARACILIMNTYSSTELINISGGEELSIFEIAHKTKELVGYSGEIIFDSNKPDGTPRKLMDNSKLKALNFFEQTCFDEGLLLLYNDYLTNFVKH